MLLDRIKRDTCIWQYSEGEGRKIMVEAGLGKRTRPKIK
jgi:hypothetical protein